MPFFTKALRQNVSDRFDNAEVMLKEWRECFTALGPPDAGSEIDQAELRRLLDEATFDSSIHEIGLGTRAINALDRANVLTVEDLLGMPMRRLLRLRGVGNKTRREIASAVKVLRERLGSPVKEPLPGEEAEEPPTGDLSRLSVDLLVQRLTRVSPREGNTVRQTVTTLLGLEEALPCVWPGQAEVVRFLNVSRARVGQIVGKMVERWGRDKALTPLRAEVAGLLTTAGGVTTAEELGEAILTARGRCRRGRSGAAWAGPAAQGGHRGRTNRGRASLPGPPR